MDQSSRWTICSYLIRGGYHSEMSLYLPDFAIVSKRNILQAFDYQNVTRLNKTSYAPRNPLIISVVTELRRKLHKFLRFFCFYTLSVSPTLCVGPYRGQTGNYPRHTSTGCDEMDRPHRLQGLGLPGTLPVLEFFQAVKESDAFDPGRSDVLTKSLPKRIIYYRGGRF